MSLQEAAATAVALAEADQADWEAITVGQWPFLRLADDLCADLLDPAWGRRHGAAVGLREILRSHAGAAGVTAALDVAPSGTASDKSTAVWCIASRPVHSAFNGSLCCQRHKCICHTNLQAGWQRRGRASPASPLANKLPPLPLPPPPRMLAG